MKPVTGVLVRAGLLFMCVPFTLLGQTGTIQGRVTEERANPLVGASVTVQGTTLGTLTSARGTYTIRNVPAGSHTVRVIRLGYTPAVATVTVSDGVITQQDFALTTRAVTLEPLEVVVGSRARHTAEDELAVPVDVFTAEEMRQQGTTEAAQVLQQLSPSVNFPRQSVTDATDIVRPFTLRGLSPDHTLVLVNGKRRHRTALVHIFGAGMGAGASGVDLNAIPASAIDRLEVLRDGAAAQYGSDAIAGVVNLALKDGVYAPVLTADAGRYAPDEFPDDGTIVDLGSAWGIGVGRGTINLFAEYRDRQPTNRAGADPEDQVVAGDADETDAEGNVVKKRNPVPQPNHHWGDGRSKDILTLANLKYPVNAAGTSEMYAFGGYSFRQGQGNGFRRQGLDDRNWPEIYPLGFLPTFDADVTDVSAAGGIRGVAGAWVYDVSASFGHNAFQYGLANTLNTSLGPCLDVACAPGLDGVLGTADDPGIPNQTEFFAGELKLNEFVGSAEVRRSVEVGLASPLSVAVGTAFRREGYEIVPGDPASYIQGGHPNRNGDPAPPGSQVFPGFQPSNAVDESRTNFGLYADLEGNLTPTFLANLAGRFESYSDFGERVTGKLALRYQPSPRVTFRGAVSTGFRAPALSQSFYGSTVTNFKLDPSTGQPTPFEVGIFPVDAPAARVLGARPLQEETSINLSGGVAVTPVENLTITVDYFHIRIDDRIILTSELGTDSVVSILANAGVAAEAARYFTNAIDTKTQGVDVTASYSIPVSEGSVLRLSGTFNWTKNEIAAIREPPELAGTDAVLFDPFLEGGQIALEKERPAWRSTLTAQFTDGRWSLLTRGSLWGKFTSVLLGVCGPDCVQEYGAEALVDAEIGYRFSDLVNVAVGAKNIFDNFPGRMSADNGFGIFLFPSASPFGFNGRYLYARTEIVLAR